MKIDVERIKTKYGEINYFETDEASFNIETILPKKKLPPFHLKNNYAYLIILEGKVNSNKGELEKGDFMKIKPKETFWMKNNSDEIVKFLSIDIPPVEDNDIIWEEGK